MWVRGRVKKQKAEPSMKKKRLSAKKKTVISLLTVFVILAISIPVSVYHLVLKTHYEGKLYISSANIIPFDQEKETLQVMFKVKGMDY